MEKISVLVCVYNEEKRIERFLKSFSRFDEVIVLDKSSTDKTVEIASSFPNVVIINMEYSDRGDLYKDCAEKARNEWVLFCTCSDIIHPQLVNELNEKVNNTAADLIYVPYMIHCHGICSQYSVFDYKSRPCLAKKSICEFSDSVHKELSFNTTLKEELKINRQVAIHHLTHQNMESSFERQLRYSKEELKKGIPLKVAFKNILRVIKTMIRVRFWKIGWDGIAMGLLLIQYNIFVFLRYWEYYRNIDVEKLYDEMGVNFENIK